VPANTLYSRPPDPYVHPVPSPVIAPQWIDVSPIDQLQFDPGAIPEASTSDTSVATEVAAGAGPVVTIGTAGAATGVTIAEALGAGAAATDVEVVEVVEVVATGGATTGVVVVVVWSGRATTALCVSTGLGVDARAAEPLPEDPNAQLVPRRRVRTAAVAIQCR